MTANENFRRNLATAIELRDLRKTHVASLARTTRQHLDRVLKGEMEPGLDLSERLAKAVGFPLVALLAPPEIFSEALLTAAS